ncbi:MAG: hypothetical protein RLZZ602_1216 [Pseudomonadota bacterium]
MSPRQHPLHTTLAASAQGLKARSVSSLFDADDTRVDSFRCSAAGISIDYSKQRLDREANSNLATLAKETRLREAFASLVAGALVNITEERPALHTLLRGTGAKDLPAESAEVDATLSAMEALVNAVHSGTRTGFTHKAFTDVVNIGIGGSDLGPRMICRALQTPQYRLRPHFVANVDPQDLDEVLATLNPETTLIVVCSKSFTTEETLTNALRARQWLLDGGAADHDIERHVVAVTTNLDAASAFGIDRGQCYPMWDWVGGRYSLWSAIGLVIALHRGWDDFLELLAGARAMDEHTLVAEAGENLPMQMALLEYWNTLYVGTDTHVVLPYSQRLESLADFLQQLTMESNGKRVNLAGEVITEPTAPVLWGSAGTIGQHSYYQLLHQGNRAFAADIILPLTNGEVDLDSHRKLAANALAQSRAFMIGRSPEEAKALAAARGQEAGLAPHFEMPGNHPHSLIMLDAVTPATLGALVAAYEHKTFFLSQLLEINAFDQWGVELGKVIGKQIRVALESGEGLDALDPSTAAAARAWIAANQQ